MNKSFPSARTAALLYAAIYAGTAAAGPIDLGVPGLDMRWDNTLRFTTGIRLDKPDPLIANDHNYDENDAKFGQGDITNARFDLLSEVDGSYSLNGNRIGARVSGAAWYDPVYSDKVKFNSAITKPEGAPPDGRYETSYDGDRYSGYTRKYYMRGGELLDAFVFANTQIASMPVNIKVGRLSQYWGESLFSAGQSVSYGQQPIDGLKASVSPGIETKEVFMPLTQIALTVQPVADLALSAQYFLEWKPMRLPQGGTFFGAADFLFDGPDRMPLISSSEAAYLSSFPDCTSPTQDNCHVPGTAPFSASARRLAANTPGNTGDYGLSARWSPEWANGPIGVYYRYFDERSPWGGINFPMQNLAIAVSSAAPGGIAAAPTAYQLIYPKNTRLYGLSYSTNVGPISVAGESTYRYHTALNNGFPSSLSGSSFGANGEGPRGNLITALANTIVLLPSTPLFNTGTITAEVAWSHLVAVTENKDNYSGVGYAGCNPTGHPGGAAGTRADGCSTRDYVGAQINVEPQWLQVLPGLDLSMPVSFFTALHGNKQDNGDGFQGEERWSAGLTGDVFQKYKATLSYSDSWAHYGKGQPYSGRDRGWLSLTFKTTF